MRRGLIGALGLFFLLFLLHIVAASQNWDVFFRLIALSITVITVMFGPFCVLVERSSPLNSRRSLNRVASLVALPLVLGLAWAYGGMTWETTPVAVLLIFSMLSHGALEVLLSTNIRHAMRSD